MPDLTLQSFMETLDTTVKIAKHNGFKIGLAVGCIAMAVPLLGMVTAHVWLTERSEGKLLHAEVEAAACHADMVRRRSMDELYGACVGADYRMQAELSNLVRGCAP